MKAYIGILKEDQRGVGTKGNFGKIFIETEDCFECISDDKGCHYGKGGVNQDLSLGYLKELSTDSYTLVKAIENPFLTKIGRESLILAIQESEVYLLSPEQ